MEETVLTPSDSPSRYAGNSKIITMAAADAVNDNIVTMSDDMLVIVRNSGTSAHTITIASQPDPNTGRTANITALSIAAGQTRVFRFAKVGWANANNQLVIDPEHAELLIGIIKLDSEVTT